MASFSKVKLSSSTSGRGILIAATGTAGTALHTATAGASNIDEVWLYAFNSAATAQLLTIEFGGVTDPNDIIEYDVPPQDGLHLIVPGNVLNGGLSVAAFAETTNVITIQGYVNRITADA